MMYLLASVFACWAVTARVTTTHEETMEALKFAEKRLSNAEALKTAVAEVFPMLPETVAEIEQEIEMVVKDNEALEMFCDILHELEASPDSPPELFNKPLPTTLSVQELALVVVIDELT